MPLTFTTKIKCRSEAAANTATINRPDRRANCFSAKSLPENCRIWKYYISAKCFRLIPTYPYDGKRSRESSGIRGFCQDTYFPIGWMFITAYHPAYKISASIFTMRAGYFSFSLLQYYLKITGKEGNTYASGKNTNSSEREIPGIPI